MAQQHYIKLKRALEVQEMQLLLDFLMNYINQMLLTKMDKINKNVMKVGQWIILKSEQLITSEKVYFIIVFNYINTQNLSLNYDFLESELRYKQLVGDLTLNHSLNIRPLDINKINEDNLDFTNKVSKNNL